MARMVLTTFGSSGDINPYVALALGLRARDMRSPSPSRRASATSSSGSDFPSRISQATPSP